MTDKITEKILLNDELMFPSDYLSAIDFKGKTVTLTIASVEKQELWTRRGAKVKPVFTFAETKKKFVCNVTNAESIAELYGRQAADWVGKRVTFFPTKVPVGRNKTDAIRIVEKIPPPKNGAPLPASVTDDPPPHPDFDGDATRAAERHLDDVLPPPRRPVTDNQPIRDDDIVPPENREPEEFLPLSGIGQRV